MSSVAQRIKLLIVDISPSMAQVLKTFADQHGYDCDVFSDSVLACEALKNRFVNIDQSYDFVLLGWPEGKIGIISDLLSRLGSVDHSDLPLIVLSDDVKPDIQALSRRRGNTHSLLWHEHKRAADIIESLVFADAPVSGSTNVKVVPSAVSKPSRQVLLVDSTSSVCNSLKELLEANNYQVNIVSTAAEARTAVSTGRYDLVVTEFFLLGESGENLCRYLKAMAAETRPVYAVMTKDIVDSVVQRSLAVGAITCLDKTESMEVLFARIHAIAQGVPQNVREAVVDTIAAEPIPVQQSLGALKPVEEVTQIADPEVSAPLMKTTRQKVLGVNAIESAIKDALSVDDEGICYSMLMLDIKMIAAATGDRLSIGGSEVMLKMVKARLAALYTRENSLAYVSNGRFVFLLATNEVKQALLLSRKLVEIVPSMINYLSEVELVSHGSFILLPRKTSQVPRFFLQHGAAGCARAELDKMDNKILVAHKNQYLPTDKLDRRKQVKPEHVASKGPVKVFAKVSVKGDKKIEAA